MTMTTIAIRVLYCTSACPYLDTCPDLKMVYANAWELLLFCPAGIRITKSHDGRSWIGEYRVAHKQTDYALQEEFLDVIFWLRQLFAVIIGIIWGVLPLKGIIGIVL